MAQRTPATPSARQTPQHVRTFPDVKPARLPPPPAEPAIRMRGVQVALWRRLRHSLRILGVVAIALAVTIVVETVFHPDGGFAVFAGVVLGSTMGILMPIGLVGAARTAHIAWRLRREAWQHHAVTDLRFAGELPITMSLIDGVHQHPIRIKSSKRSETLRGMIHLDVWFIGDPAKSGLLTPAGGGEILWTRPNPPRRVRPAKPRKPSKPRKVKPVDPEKARRRAATMAERNAKAAARSRAWAEKHPIKPQTPAIRPKPKPLPPKPPKFRGQKIKWQ